MPDLTAILNSINFSKDIDLIDEYNQSDYVPFVINKAMSQHIDTLLHANELNSRPNIPKIAQYKYYCYSVTKKKRFGKWLKSTKESDVQALQKYLNISYKIMEYTRNFSKFSKTFDYIRYEGEFENEEFSGYGVYKNNGN